MTRHNFTPRDKELLAKRVGYHCSNPSCGVSTIGPSNRSDDAEYVGVAAHIYSASIDNGPRANPSFTEAERSSISNAIHLCNKCSTLIDKNNGTGYPASVLFAWKSHAEKEAKSRVYSVKTMNNYKDVDFSNLEVDYSTALSCTGLNEKNVKSCPTNEILLTDITNKLNLANKCVIKGRSGSGKSLLTYQVAYAYHNKGYAIFNINKDSLTKKFSFVAPQEKSVVVIDDAQIIAPQYLENALSDSHKNCLVLVNWNSSTSIDDGFLRNFPFVDISSASQVKMLEKHCLQNKEKIAQTLRLIGLNIDVKNHHDRVESRIYRAAQEDTPWLFNYSLTEGWNAAKHDLDILDDDQKLSLVVVTVSIFQFATLDKGVGEQVILTALRELRCDDEWLRKAERVIRKYCQSIDGNVKNKHYEYARRVLKIFLSQNNSRSEFEYLINLITSILKSDVYLSGHSNLLEFVMFDFRRGQHELNQRGVIKDYVLALLRSPTSINDEPAKITKLNSLIRFDKNVLKLLEGFHVVLESWILNVCRKSAYSLSNLLNTLANGKYSSFQLTKNHVENTFESLFEAHPEDKPRFAHLINRMQFFLDDELKAYEKELLVADKLYVNVNSFSNETACYQFSTLINELAFINQDWADTQVKNNIEGISQLLNKDLMDSYSSLKDLIDNYFGVTYAILGIPLSDTRLKKRAKSLARKLDIEPILGAFDKLEVVDVQNYCNVIIFLALYDQNKLKVISDRFNYDRLYELYETDKKLDHFHRGLISILQNKDSINYLNYVSKIVLRYNYVDELFVVLSPEFALGKIKDGMRYKMVFGGRSECRNELIILKEIMKEDKGDVLVKRILEENITPIEEAIFNKAINVDNSKRKLMLLVYIHSIVPDLFRKIFEDKGNNDLLVEKIWRLIKGKKIEKDCAKLYTYLLKNYSGCYTSQIAEIEKRYPSISRFDIAQFK
jgi:hypothetical protein